MKFRELVAMLDTFQTEDTQGMTPTIYLSEPWSPDSEATVGWSPPKGGLPQVAAAKRLVRLVDVQFAARLFFSDKGFEYRSRQEFDSLCDLIVQRVLSSNQPMRRKTSNDGDA